MQDKIKEITAKILAGRDLSKEQHEKLIHELLGFIILDIYDQVDGALTALMEDTE